MSPLDEVVAKLACAELIEAYTQAVNDNDVDAFVALFTEDGTWIRPGSPPMHGRAAMREFMLGRPSNRTLRHVTGGVLITLHGAGVATSRSQSLVFTGPAAQALPVAGNGLVKMVEYVDRLVATSEGWRIAERLTTTVFSEPGIF